MFTTFPPGFLFSGQRVLFVSAIHKSLCSIGAAVLTFQFSLSCWQTRTRGSQRAPAIASNLDGQRGQHVITDRGGREDSKSCCRISMRTKLQGLAPKVLSTLSGTQSLCVVVVSWLCYALCTETHTFCTSMICFEMFWSFRRIIYKINITAHPTIPFMKMQMD